MQTNMNLERCLERINCEAVAEVSLDALAALQLAFVQNVPFENLDIHLGRRIELSGEKIYRKIVDERRGGFCYECNTLFHDLLTALGYEVCYLAAAMQLDTSRGMDFEHMALLVRIDGTDYMVDVGNGQSCLQPMALESKDVVNWEGIDYRLAPHKDRLALEYRPAGEDWKPRFTFSLTARALPEFTELCNWNQESPTAIFTQNRLLTIARPRGRVNLVGRNLEIIEDSTVEERELGSNEEYIDALARYFDIKLEKTPPGW